MSIGAELHVLHAAWHLWLAGVVALFSVNSLYADTVNVAVASNALPAIKYLSAEYTQQTGNQVNISSGSTGKLYAQIINGAPFDIFMAANVSEPRRLEQQQRIISGSRFTYAVGNLSLCAYGTAFFFTGYEQGLEQLAQGRYQRLAIANPKVAPYGKAAREFLQKAGLWQTVKAKLIQGENINQTFRYLISGNVQYAIVAHSQVKQYANDGNIKCTSIPHSLYSPLRQQSVVLSRARDNIAALAFVNFMKQDSSKELLQEKFGYAVVEGP